MNMLIQSLHIARKDLRESRWVMLVYAALLAVATADVARAASRDPIGNSALPMFFVVIAGMLLVGVVVQADAPARPDAFWATRPLRPSAVLTAKLLIALGVLVVGLAGQAAAISAFGMGGIPLAARLPRAAGAYALWLLVALLMAALTRDLKAFVAATVCILMAPALATGLWLSPNQVESIGGTLVRVVVGASPAGVAALHVAAWLGPPGCIVLLLWLYRGSDLRRSSRAACIAVAAGGLLAAMNPPWTVWPWIGSRSVPPSDQIAAAAVSTAFLLNPTDPSKDSVVIRATPPVAGQQLTLLNTDVAITLADGSIIHLTGPGAFTDVVRPELPGARWVTATAHGEDGARSQLSLSPRAHQAMARGIVRVSVSPSILAAIPRVAGSVRLAKGELLVRDGLTARIESWSYESGDATVNLRISSLSGDELDRAVNVEFALVNHARHEALPLFQRNSVGGTDWLVVPGDSATTNVLSLTTRPDKPSAFEVRDPGWFQGARLVVIDKRVLGSYTAHTQADIR